MTSAKAVIISPPSSEAARRIRQYILHHSLKPGDQLPTHDVLGQQLKVGPRRLREGLSVLMHQGIIETRNKGGTIVRRPSFKTLNEPISWHLDATGYQLEDLVSARAWLESGAAAEAAQKRTARDLLKILDALEQLEALIDADRSDWLEDEAFHLAIMEATHNPVMVTFGQLVRLNFRGSDAAKPPPADWRRAFNEQHRRIYEAIERQDATAARDLMYTHVTSQLSHLSVTEEGTC
jgi:GntR family transcriptional regulator, transcriptional repressor for pyruvate dehydrogenase complex